MACPCSGRWTIEACDLATGRVRALLPAVAIDLQTILNGVGQGTITVPVKDISARDVWPGLTSIYATRLNDDGDPEVQFAGMVQRPAGTGAIGGGTVQIGVKSIEQYLYHRRVRVDLNNYFNVPQTQIGASLVNQALPNGIPLTGLWEPSAYNRDRTYIAAERPLIGELIENLANSENGPDWYLTHTKTNGMWATTMTFVDSFGADSGLLLRGDVHGSAYGLDIDAATLATLVDGFGEDTSGNRVMYTATDPAGIYPQFDAAPAFGTVANNMLQQQTEGYLNDYREPVAIPTFTISGPDPAPADLRNGDTADFHTSNGFVSFHGEARLLGTTWSVQEGQPETRALSLLASGRPSQTVLNQSISDQCEVCR